MPDVKRFQICSKMLFDAILKSCTTQSSTTGLDRIMFVLQEVIDKKTVREYVTQ